MRRHEISCPNWLYRVALVVLGGASIGMAINIGKRYTPAAMDHDYPSEAAIIKRLKAEVEDYREENVILREIVAELDPGNDYLATISMATPGGEKKDRSSGERQSASSNQR